MAGNGRILLFLLSFLAINAEWVEQVSHKVIFSGRTPLTEQNGHVTLQQSDLAEDAGMSAQSWNKRDVVIGNNGMKFSEGLDKRIKRQLGTESGLTEEQKLESVIIHNAVRRLENSSNMEFMIWNDYLADMVQEWLELCIWGHGRPDRDPDTMPFNPVGQNLYFNTGFINVTHAVIRLYDERSDYVYETGACTGPICGHYTQLTWAKSREVGCGFHKCPILTDSDDPDKQWKKAYFYGCNYGPAGNYVNQKPFLKGPACTKCPNGNFWCDTEEPRGLCRRDCDEESDKCTCAAACQNGGVLGCNCSCLCQPGFSNIDCEDVCEDLDRRCNAGWPPRYCTHNVYGERIRTMCPKMCEMCDTSGDPVSPPICDVTTEPPTTELVTTTEPTTTTTTEPTTTTTEPTTTTTEPTTTTTEPTTTTTTPSTTTTPATSSSTSVQPASTTTLKPTSGDDSPSSGSLWAIALAVIAMDVLLLGVVTLLVLIVRRRQQHRKQRMVIKYQEGPSSDTPRGSLRAYKPSILADIDDDHGHSHYAKAKDADAALEYINVDLNEELPDEFPPPPPPLPPPAKGILKPRQESKQDSMDDIPGELFDKQADNEHFFPY